MILFKNVVYRLLFDIIEILMYYILPVITVIRIIGNLFTLFLRFSFQNIYIYIYTITNNKLCINISCTILQIGRYGLAFAT